MKPPSLAFKVFVGAVACFVGLIALWFVTVMFLWFLAGGDKPQNNYPDRPAMPQPVRKAKVGSTPVERAISTD